MLDLLNEDLAEIDAAITQLIEDDDDWQAKAKLLESEGLARSPAPRW